MRKWYTPVADENRGYGVWSMGQGCATADAQRCFANPCRADAVARTSGLCASYPQIVWAILWTTPANRRVSLAWRASPLAAYFLVRGRAQSSSPARPCC